MHAHAARAGSLASSSKLVTDFLDIDDRIFDFCNGICRDKTVADAEVWPEFMGIYHS